MTDNAKDKSRHTRQCLLTESAAFYFFAVTFLACLLLLPSDHAFAAKKHNKKKISITCSRNTSGNYYADGVYTLQLTNAASKIRWSVSNPAVASNKKKKRNKAVLTPVKGGSVTIKAVYKGKTYKKKVKIKKARLQVPSAVFYPGATCVLTLRGASKEIKWSLSGITVASIKKTGKNKARLTFKNPGSVTVRAKFKGITYRKTLQAQVAVGSVDALYFQDASPQMYELLGVTGAPQQQVTNWDSIESVSAEGDLIYWAIMDPRIVSITSSGKGAVMVTPKRTGYTKIAAKYKNILFYAEVYVYTDPGYAKPDLYGKDAAYDNLSLPDLELPQEIPAYWEKELANTIATAKRRGAEEGDMSSFIFLTDVHWGMNAKVSPPIVNYLSSQLDLAFTMIGGDVVTSLRTGLTKGLTGAQYALNELKDFYDSFDPEVSLMSTVGNHDINTASETSFFESDRVTDEELYHAMLEKSGKEVHISPGTLESWTDDTRHKIRYISFFYDKVHTNGISEEKLAWIDQKVKELDSTWTVVLFSHAYWNGANIGKENKVPAAAQSLARHLANLDAEAPADIALWMVGHCHRDNNDRIVSDDGRAEIAAASTNCDSYSTTKSEIWGGEKMIKGSNTEQAMDLVQIDTRNHRIFLTRIGAGSNRVLYY